MADEENWKAVDGTEFSGWNDKDYLKEMADEENWKAVDGKHYCDECHEYNDDDELVINNKEE
jgi:hypothetical protein